jgi:hypothetical protein
VITKGENHHGWREGVILPEGQTLYASGEGVAEYEDLEKVYGPDITGDLW